jgi:intein/homing endonuclease
MWLEKEYYYDARKTMRQKSDYDYTQDFIKWLGGITPDAIFIDPSASSFKVELRRQGIKNLRDAVNDVVPGIRFQGQLISNGTYKVCSCCTESIKEYSNYVWDEKASRQGDEKPIKKFDHCFTGESLVLTTKGKIQIKDIKKDDYVVTQYGIDKVIGTWKSIEEESIVELKINGLSTYVTPNHKYFTKNRGYIPVNQLTHNDILITIKPYNEEIWKKKKSFLKEEITLDIQKVPIYPLGRILDAQVEYSIETYENSTMEAYQKDIKSITKMEIPQTMTLRILHVFQKKNMTNSIMMKYQIDQKKDTLDMEKLCANFQKNGMVLKKGESGIVNMLKINGKIENQENAYVNIAKKNIKLFTINLNFVQTHVDQQIEEIQKLMISIKNALYAEKNSMLIGIRENSHVQNNVLPQPELKKEIVYNLTTEKYNTYIVNDICVSNCQDAQRYCLFSQFFQKASLSTMTEADADRMEREYRFSGGDYGYQGRR